jgi:hypothetical protein
MSEERNEKSEGQENTENWPHGYDIVIQREPNPVDSPLTKFATALGLRDITVGERGVAFTTASAKADEIRKQLKSDGGEFEVTIVRHLPDYLLH